MDATRRCCCAEFDQDQWARVDAVIDAHHGEPGALIPVLEEVQAITGYLPEAVQRRVAAGLSLPVSHVFGVVTFYSFFTMKPRGKHQIRVCLGTACHVRGAQRNLRQLAKTLDLEPGECTDDRHFGLEVVRCLGACGLAPVLLVNEHVYKQVKQSQLHGILEGYQDAGETVD